MPTIRLALALSLFMVTAPAAAPASAQVPAPPPNDNRSSATAVTSIPFQETVDMTLATEEPGEDRTCSENEKSIWYSYSPTQTRDVHLEATFLGPTLYGTARTVSIWEPDGDGVRFVNCGRGYAVELEAGKQYLFRIGSFMEERGSVRFQVRLGGRISGTIRNTSAEPIENECATIFQRSQAGDYYAVVPSARSAADGRYMSAPVPAGTYYVRFGCPISSYETSWFDGETAADADPIQIGFGQRREDIDGVLARPRSIAGVVTDTDGKPQSTFCVDAFDANGNHVPRTLTNLNGSYVLKVPEAGSYKVRFGCGDARNAVEQWWQNAPDMQSADPVEVGDEQTRGIDAAVQLQVEPVNDDLEDALLVVGSPFSDLRYNLNATMQANEPQPCGATRGSVWYRLEASETGSFVAAAAAEGNFAGAVAVFTGTGLDDLQALGCHRASDLYGTAAVNFEAAQGQTYWIQSSASNSGYGYVRTTVSRYLGASSTQVEPTASCLPSCPHNKTIAQHLLTPSDGEPGCDPSPSAPTGSYTDTQMVVPDTTASGVPSHLDVSIDPVFDDDLFICRTHPDAQGKRLKGKSANTIVAAIFPLTCNIGCAERVFVPISPGESITIRVYRAFGTGPTPMSIGFAVGG